MEKDSPGYLRDRLVPSAEYMRDAAYWKQKAREAYDEMEAQKLKALTSGQRAEPLIVKSISSMKEAVETLEAALRILRGED